VGGGGGGVGGVATWEKEKKTFKKRGQSPWGPCWDKQGAAGTMGAGKGSYIRIKKRGFFQKKPPGEGSLPQNQNKVGKKKKKKKKWI